MQLKMKLKRKKDIGGTSSTRSFSLSGKKGMSMAFIVGVIITLAAFILLAFAIKGFMTTASAKEAEMVCASSVSIRAAATLGIAGKEIRVTPVLCKTIDREITGDREEIKRQFANHMAKCWEMFGEGRYEQNIFDSFSIFGGEKRCFMCYTLIVEESDNFKKGDSISAEEFKDFLMDNEHPKLKGWSYLRYFQEHGGDGAVLGIFSKDRAGKEIGITPNHAYAVGYKVHADKCVWCEKLLGIGSLAAGVGALFLAVPTGGASLAAVAAVVGGGATAIAAGTQMIDEEFFSGIDIDTIYVVDMNNEQLNQLLSQVCEKVEEDIAE
jgi:hypothetical protein